MEGHQGSASDRGLGKIATEALCAAECDKRESCTFYAYNIVNEWCYLWQGATCSPTEYTYYTVKQKVCDDSTGNS